MKPLMARSLAFWLSVIVTTVEMKSMDQKTDHASKRGVACFGTLGCFSSEAPFTSAERPNSDVPEGPDRILTKFLLFTKDNPKTAEELDARYPQTAISTWTNFKPRPTKILIHGFMDSPNLTQWTKEFRDELFKHGNGEYNVITVDWSSGNGPPYSQACANARVVGAQISELIKALSNSSDLTVADFHVIGHSLGAHVAGYAGERVPGLGRITGLDPAGPYFEHTDKVVKLDPTDAVFVDAIHTDGRKLIELGLGMKEQSGHADFYPNLGHDQPECTHDPIVNLLQNTGIINGILETVACSHYRAVKYFIESVNTQCPFVAFPCASEEDFTNNLCTSCAGGSCSSLGLNADKHKPPAGQQVKYYLTTSGKEPFCEYHLDLNVKFTYGQGDTETGTVSISVIGQSGSVTIGDSTKLTITPGHSYRFHGLLPKDFGTVQSVVVSWNHVDSILDPLHWNILGLRHPKLYVDEVEVYREEAAVDVRLCAKGQSVETGHSLTISTKC